MHLRTQNIPLCLAVGLVLVVTSFCHLEAEGAPRRQPDHGIAQVAQINEHIEAMWKEWGLTPSVDATENEWCRRVFLDVIGRIPSVDELNAFLRSNHPDKRSQLVEQLLNDSKYTEEYARNWTTIWTNLLIGRSGGTDRRSLVNREGMQKYLRDSFATNKPYDRMVHELVTATGSSTPGEPGFNGAVNFLADKVNEDKATLATATTARLFLGLQVQCTQCHNHPFNEWKQQKFWELNAFFRQTRALRRFESETRQVSSIELVNEDFPGESNRPQEADIYYELRNGQLSVAYPVFVNGTSIPASGYVDEVNRRTRLGELIVNSEYLPQAMVNRMWAHFLGYGFTKPVDDMGPHNPPSNPLLLDYVSKEFAKHSFDVKELIRWIVLSRPYALSSRTNSSNEQDDPQLGELPKYSRFYLRQMRAEELYESLLVATAADRSRGTVEEQERARREWLSQFIVAFGNDEGEETTTFNGTIQQALMMFNGDMTRQATSGERGSFLWNIANSSQLRPQEKIDYLYLAALARKPDKNELAVANALFVARKGDMLGALQDMWWALLNSNEFLFNH